MSLLHGSAAGSSISIIRITKCRISGGLSHREDVLYTSAEMIMEGKLHNFKYKQLDNQLKPTFDSKNTKVNVEINFMEVTNIEETNTYDLHNEDFSDENDRNYIGNISLLEHYEDQYQEIHDGIWVDINIRLPIAMFLYLYSMDGKLVRFETIHDLIEQPASGQIPGRGLVKVALVKRVHFETESPLPHPQWPFVQKSKRWKWS